MLVTESFHTAGHEHAASVETHCNDEQWATPLSIIEQVPGVACKTIATREHVYLEGDEKSHIYFVESGAVCVYKILADGRRQVIDFALPGDIIGLGTSAEHGYSAQATVATKVRCLATGSLNKIARSNPAFGMMLYDFMSHELDAARDLLVTVGQRNAMQRISAFLLSLSERNVRHNEDPSLVLLPMTRTDVADFLGLTIETVSRTITKLKTRGIIKLQDGGRIRLLDADALSDICAEEH